MNSVFGPVAGDVSRVEMRAIANVKEVTERGCLNLIVKLSLAEAGTNPGDMVTSISSRVFDERVFQPRMLVTEGRTSA